MCVLFQPALQLTVYNICLINTAHLTKLTFYDLVFVLSLLLYIEAIIVFKQILWTNGHFFAVLNRAGVRGGAVG